MKLIREINEAASNEYSDVHAAFDYVDKKRDPLEYVVVQDKKTNKFLVVGHMAWSQWRDRDNYKIINTRPKR